MCAHIQIEEGQRTGKVHRPQEPGNPASPRRRCPVSAAHTSQPTRRTRTPPKGGGGVPRALLVAAQEGEKQQPGATACACLCTPAKESRQPPPPPPPVTKKWQHADNSLRCRHAEQERGDHPYLHHHPAHQELQAYPARTSTLAHSLSFPKQPRPASRSTNKRFCSQTSHQSVSGCVNACGISSCSHRVHMCQDRDGKEAVLGRGGRPAAPSPAHQAGGHGQGLGLGGCRHCGARETSGCVLCRQAPAAVAGCTGDVCGGSRHLAALVRAALLSCCCCGCCYG